MTHVRPAWYFSVLNLDSGWVYSTYEGMAYDPAQAVQLADKVTMGWAFEDGQVPAQTEPDSCTFGLFCKTADDVPRFDKGDRITAVLTRPTSVAPWNPPATSVTYIKFVGRITDADTEVDPQKGVLLDMIAMDNLSELGQSYDYGPGPNANTNINDSLGRAIQTVTGAAYHYDTAEASAVLSNSPNGNVPVRDAARKLLMAAATGIKAQFLRCALPFLSYPGGWAQYPVDGRAATTSYYPHTWYRGILNLPVALLKFGFSAADPDRVILRTNTDADPFAGNADTNPAVVGVSVIPAKVVKSPQKFNLNRGDTPNRVEVETINGFNPDGDPFLLTFYAEDPASVTRYGATVRKVETFGDAAGMLGHATSLLAYTAPGALWASDAITLLTKAMTDAELDRFANNFFPHPQVSLSFRRHIAILNIAEDVDVTAGLLFGDLAGATFRIEGGELEIDLNVRPASMYWPGGVTLGPTIDEWNASAYANTYLTDQGGANDYIDPDMTLDHIAVSKL